MNAVYWGLTALCIMKRKEALDAEEMIEYVMSCWDDNAGTSVTPIVPTNGNSLPTCQHSTPPPPKVLSAHTQDTTRTSSPR